MSRRDIFSYKVFYFEKYWHCDHSYKRADAYPAHALVTATTHDLPTVKGFWCEADLKLRDDLGLFPNTEYRNKQYSDRDQDRTHLIDVLQQEGLWQQAEIVDGDMPPGLNEALHAFLARSSAALMMIQIEDMLEVGEQTNLPGTTLEYPNWRRKLPLSLHLWATDARITNLIDRVQVERSRNV
jgi:4-alpha-glucanotransferase